MNDEKDEFAKALRKLPPSISCFANGAACPWCGVIHRTVTFGEMTCAECRRAWCFGYPDWHVGVDPISYVNFPWKEWDAMGRRADILEDWQPTDLLKAHYHQQMEDRTGIYPNEGKPQ